MKDTLIKSGAGLLVGAAIASATVTVNIKEPTYEKKGEKIEISRDLCIPATYSGTPDEIQGWITSLENEEGLSQENIEWRRAVKARLQEDLVEVEKIEPVEPVLPE